MGNTAEIVAVASDLNEHYKQFLPAGCDNAFDMLGDIIGVTPGEFLLEDQGSADTQYATGNIGRVSGTSSRGARRCRPRSPMKS